ncbi:unnamed protein product [Sphagnum jensenii]|uniref:Uncharacterized protein n=1 Tax=Sphagnum jensenii TaxID=128206 RepID=A0ABP1ASD6_9BRYO
MIGVEPRRVFLSLGGSLPKKDEWLGEGNVLECFPVFPNSLVSFPSALRHGALEQVVLGRFFGSSVTNFAIGGDPHELDPGYPGSFLGEHSNWVVVVYGEGEGLVARGLDAAASRGLLEFYYASLAGVALPPQIKFLTTPRTWLHILGLRFQHVASGEVEADLDSKVLVAFPFRDPFKSYFSAPGPGSFLFTGPDGG